MLTKALFTGEIRREYNLPALLLIVPLIGVIIANIPARKAGAKIVAGIASAVCVIQMGISATSGSLAWADATEFLNTGLPFGAKLQIDLTGAIALFTIGLVALVSLVINRSTEDRRGFNFANLLMMIVIGMNGIVMVRDIFSLYVFLEITGVTSFIMIAMQKRLDAFEGAFKYLVMSALASVSMLLAIAIVFLTTGGVDYGSLSAYLSASKGALPAQMYVSFILFITGFSIKSGAFPFHGWLPDAYSSAPTPVSVLLSGIVTKTAGIYVIMRLMMDVFGDTGIVGRVFMIIGSASILVGAVAAIGQKNYKRLLAYSSISQLGYITLAAGLGTPLAFAGALLHFFNHAVFKSLLFVNASAVETATGTLDMDAFGGLGYRMPVTAGTSVVGFLSAAGIPPLSGFWSKLLIIIALMQAKAYVFAGIALLGSVLTLCYTLYIQKKVFFGKLKEEWEHIKEARPLNTVPALVLAGITAAVGVLFPLVLLWMQSEGLI
jgi:proton-translocating NADH-quinone oxidoreductase chain N